MIHPKLTADVISRLKQINKSKGIKDAKDYLRSALGTKKTQTNHWYAEIFGKNIRPPVGAFAPVDEKPERPPQSHAAKATFTGNIGVAEVAGKQIKTLDDLIEACQIDLDVWRVDKFVVNKWEVAMREPATTVGGAGNSAFIVENEKGGKHTLWTRGSNIPLHEPLYQVKAWLVKKKEEGELKALLEAFVKSAGSHAPKSFSWKRSAPKTGRLLEVSVMDAHYAKLCWAKEVAKPYDIKIAVEEHRAAVYNLVNMARENGITKILMPVGNDLFNSDNLMGTTTAGTPQATSEDSRWQKTFTTGCESLSDIIETLASEFEVDVLIVPGNHDYERCYYLGEYLRAWFRNHPKVTVDNAPTQRKYYTFGSNLLMFTHGNEEKHTDLPLIMATEAKESWAKTTCREIHVGHLHQEKVTESKGVKVRVLPSLVPSDAWSTSKGYVGNIRGAEAFLYDPTKGLLAVYYHNADV
jgi:predicted phosphodiesterase